MSTPLLTVLHERAALRQALTGYCREHGFLEVDTPVRLAAPALEDHVDAIPAHGAWLRTSPELHLKRLLAAGAGRVCQLGPCFRLGERGRRHRPEFLLFEYYLSGADYRELLTFTEGLVRHAAAALGSPLATGAPWERLTVHEAFARYAHTTPEAALARDEFERLLVEAIEPHLGATVPTVLLDYPVALGALARRKPGQPALVERWELYVGGLELANAFGELTDPIEQRQRFLATAEFRRRRGREVYPLDEAFLAALDRLPPAAGCALGFERLHMALTGAADIAAVLPFPDE
jgi:lysyl-tRNA synthetase class 2